MARNPDNVKIWQDARVRLSAEVVRPALPATISEAFDDEDWPEVGILDGEDGFGEERSNSETKTFGWGIGLVKIGARNFELARKFSLLEDNEITRGLVRPGSTATKVKMPKPVYRYISFEGISDFGEVERLTSTKRARIWVPADNRNESDATKWEVQVALFADSVNDIFDRQAGTPS